MTGLFVNNLTVIDFSYADKYRGIVGESFIIDVELYGELDPQGMIFDFGSVKKQLKTSIEELADHKLWVPEKMDGVQVDCSKERCNISWHGLNGQAFKLSSPSSAVYRIQQNQINIQQLEREFANYLIKACPENIDKVVVRIRTEIIDEQYYHYTHGLKMHLGDCQRIAHGHRSRIKIYTDNERNSELEHRWSTILADGYIGNKSDIINQTKYSMTFGYQAQQGYFEITVPLQIVTLMDKDTTVENIAEFIARKIHEEDNSNVRVHAYEGVEKGAIYSFIAS